MSPQDSFTAFWQSYPRREARKKALECWLRLKPDQALLDRILTALEWQRQKPQWLKDDGQFVPLPATWLRGERWLDEPPQVKERSTETWTQWKQTHLTH